MTQEKIMGEKVCEAPSTNRGLLDTRESGQNAIVDWLEVTLKNTCEIDKIFEVFKLKKDDFELRDWGKKFYKKSAVNENITIYYDGVNDGMGVNIQFTGQGCRQYESYFGDDFSWYEVFQAIHATEFYNIPRLDLAIDDYEQQLNIGRLVRLMEQGCVLAGRMKHGEIRKTVELATGKNAGTTFYLGKKEWLLRFYEKKHERINKGFEVSHESWNRYEVQFMSHTAKNMLQYLLNGVPVGYALKEFLNAKIAFKVKNKTDTNRSRWKNQPFWDKFLDNVGKIEFIKKEREYSVERSFRWFDNQVSSTFYMLQNSIDPYLMKEYFTKLGNDKMNHTKQKAIDTFIIDSDAVEAIERHMKEYLEVDNEQMIIDNRIQMSEYFDKTKEQREKKIAEIKAKKKYELEKQLMEDMKKVRNIRETGQEKNTSGQGVNFQLFENIVDTYN